MHEINITVRNKVATRDGTDYVCGNSDYVVNFDFDAEWDAYETKTARFAYNGKIIDVIFDGAQCTVPVINNAYFFHVGVFAGDLRTTTPVRVPCIKSILCGGGTPADPPDNVYNQIMEEINSLSISGLSTVQIAALDALFKIAVYKEDASAAYSAFRTAFGLDEVPDEGGDSGDSGGGSGDNESGGGETTPETGSWQDGKFYFELSQGRISFYASLGYSETASNRASYVGLACTVTPGKSYRLLGLDGVQYGVQTITEIGYEKVLTGSNLVNAGIGASAVDKLDSGWQSSGYEFIADSSAVCIWVTSRFPTNATITPEQAMPVYLEEVV